MLVQLNSHTCTKDRLFPRRTYQMRLFLLLGSWFLTTGLTRVYIPACYADADVESDGDEDEIDHKDGGGGDNHV